MSFDRIAKDLFALFQLAWKVADTCRQVCGEQELLTREVASLHSVVCSLQQEAERPNSSLRWQDEVTRKELKRSIRGSWKVLRIVDQVLAQYALTLGKHGPRRGLFRSIVFGNGQEIYMDDLLDDLLSHKTSLTKNLRLLTPSSRGSVDWPLGKKYSKIQHSIHRTMAEISSSHDGSSFSSSSSDEEGSVWEQVKRGLERNGWWKRDVKKHRRALKQYVKSLDSSDSFDEHPPPAHPSMQRHPEESHSHDDFPPEPFHREPFPQPHVPPPPMPPQHFTEQGFPPPNLPPPDFVPLSFPQHAFPPPPPPPNFSKQTFCRQISPRQEFTRQIFPQPNFTRQIFSPGQSFAQASIPPAGLPQEEFLNESFPREVYSDEIDAPQNDMAPSPPPSNYVHPSVSDDCSQSEGEPAFVTLPPQPQSQPRFEKEPAFVTLQPQPAPQFEEQPSFIQIPPRQDPHFEEAPPFVTLPSHPNSNASPTFIQLPHHPSPQHEDPAFVTLPPQPQPQSDFITLPPQPASAFSVRPGDLAETFQCTPTETWNDMLETLVTTLIDTSKTLYFPCSICKKCTATGPARLDRSQNWCRNCFHAIVYNVLYYPSSPPSALNSTLRPISQKRMDDIVTPQFIELWEKSFEALRAMKGRPADGMIMPSEEEIPLILFRNAVVKGEEGRCMRQGYFELAYFEEPFESFAARRKQKL